MATAVWAREEETHECYMRLCTSILYTICTLLYTAIYNSTLLYTAIYNSTLLYTAIYNSTLLYTYMYNMYTAIYKIAVYILLLQLI